jgi:hypothetical protein
MLNLGSAHSADLKIIYNRARSKNQLSFVIYTKTLSYNKSNAFSKNKSSDFLAEIRV